MTRRDVLRGAGFAFCIQDFIQAAQEAPVQTLPGTQLLSWQGDLSERMMDGAHKYVERKIAESVKARQQYWSRDLSSRAAYEKSIESNRSRFRMIIGVVDAREPVMMERFGDDDDSPLVAETGAYRIHQVRWPVLEGVWGEGLMLEPTSSPAVLLSHSTMPTKRRNKLRDWPQALRWRINSRGTLPRTGSKLSFPR